MTTPIAVNSGGSPHESKATLHGMLGNAAGKSPDVALAQLHPRSRGGLPPRALQRVREYVEAHLEKNISLQMLASTAGLSMSHFARAFKQSQGVPPHEYLVRCRVRRVQELLATTDLPLSEIARASGFSDQSHCTRRFREQVGVTPSGYRWSMR
jgi:transcriptional regulator GlxA family with amidase domain